MAQDTRTDPDEILLNRVIINHDREALGTLHTRYYAVVISYIAQHVKPREDANDLACDVFTELCQGKSRYQGGASVGSYLQGMARRLIGRHFRKQRRRANRLSSGLTRRGPMEDDPSRTRTIQELRMDLEEALSLYLAGAPHAAEAIRLVVIDHLNMQEAAHRAGCSLSRFSDRFHYGVRVLKRTGSLSSYTREPLRSESADQARPHDENDALVDMHTGQRSPVREESAVGASGTFPPFRSLVSGFRGPRCQ